MADKSDGFKKDVVYEAEVFDSGTVMAHMRPEAVPFMVNVVDHILKDSAYLAPAPERARLNALRRELFRIFPEQKNGYIADPVEAIRD